MLQSRIDVYPFSVSIVSLRTQYIVYTHGFANSVAKLMQDKGGIWTGSKYTVLPNCTRNPSRSVQEAGVPVGPFGNWDIVPR